MLSTRFTHFSYSAKQANTRLRRIYFLLLAHVPLPSSHHAEKWAQKFEEHTCIITYRRVTYTIKPADTPFSTNLFTVTCLSAMFVINRLSVTLWLSAGKARTLYGRNPWTTRRERKPCNKNGNTTYMTNVFCHYMQAEVVTAATPQCQSYINTLPFRVQPASIWTTAHMQVFASIN